MSKNTVLLTENQLHRVIKESVNKVLIESELGDKVASLRKQSRTYQPDDMGQELCLNKTWNRGMGSQNFIQILPEEGVILYNTMHTKQRDLERIQQVFPEFKLEPVDKPYYSKSSLRYHRNKG